MRTIAASIALFVLMCACVTAQENALSDAKKIKVTVGGWVIKPGTYHLGENATITDAINAAGGPNYSGESGGAAMHHVRVIRKGAAFRIDVKKILAHEAENFVLQEQDSIQIPEVIF